MAAFAQGLRARGGFGLAQVKFEGCLVYIDTLLVAKLRNGLGFGLHVLRHTQLRAWPAHAKLGDCKTCGASGRSQRGSAYRGERPMPSWPHGSPNERRLNISVHFSFGGIPASPDPSQG